jgi:hypothetical protein
MKNIEFKKPTKSEAIALVIMLFSLFGLYQAANLYLVVGQEWRPHFSANFDLPGALMFWLFFLIFHIGTMYVAARSMLVKAKNSTWNGFDFAAGFTMIIGLYFIAISTIYGVFKGQEAIEFLFNMKYPILLNIGFAIEAVGVLWFGITD